MKNLVILIGRLGADPELKELNGGAKVCSFSLATSKKFKDKTSGEKKEITQWHRIKCWNATADLAAQYLKKGHQVYVEGEIEYREYEKDGVKKYATDIVVNSLQFLESRPALPVETIVESGELRPGSIPFKEPIPNLAPTMIAEANKTDEEVLPF